MRDTIEVSTDLLEQMAFDSGLTIKLGKTKATLKTRERIFWAPLPLPQIPAQRSGDDR